jgi:hypothetical protein
MTNWSLTILLLHLWSLFLITFYFYDFKKTALFKKIFEKKALENNDVQQQQALNETSNQTADNCTEIIILKDVNPPTFVRIFKN